MYRKQSEMVKDWLTAYRNEELIIGEQLERLRELRARIMSVGAQEITDMPRAPVKIRDTLAEYMIRAEELESRLNYRLMKHESDRAAIIRLLEKLTSNDERKIIRHRYLYGREWSEILPEIYQNAEGFIEKQESYRRKMYRTHESALEDMAKLWDEKTD